MFKKIAMAAVAAMVVFTSACSSVETASVLNDTKLATSEQLESVGHLNVDIWGVYLFSFPILSGSFRKAGDCRMFENTVTVGNAVDMLTANAQAKYNCQVVTDVTSYRESSWVPPFFIIRKVQASGNILR